MKIIELTWRPETGAVRAGQDWPGVFIRGDEALGLASDIRAAQAANILPTCPLLDRLVDLLKLCEVSDRG